MATSLSNLTRLPRTYILHAPGSEAGEVLPKVRQAVVVELHDPKTGARSTSATAKRFPGAITLQPKGLEGDTWADLPDVVALVPEIARDVRAGLLRSEVSEPPTPAEPTADSVSALAAAQAAAAPTPAPDPPTIEPDLAPAAPPTTTRKSKEH